jgi:hypothetical protein
MPNTPWHGMSGPSQCSVLARVRFDILHKQYDKYESDVIQKHVHLVNNY